MSTVLLCDLGLVYEDCIWGFIEDKPTWRPESRRWDQSKPFVVPGAANATVWNVLKINTLVADLQINLLVFSLNEARFAFARMLRLCSVEITELFASWIYKAVMLSFTLLLENEIKVIVLLLAAMLLGEKPNYWLDFMSTLSFVMIRLVKCMCMATLFASHRNVLYIMVICIL